MICTDRDTLLGDGDDHAAIEAIEQQLIQHLRTAGIRKQREVELINQVMILRRERRRSFSAISLSMQKVVDENGNLKAMLSIARKQIEFEIKVRNDCISDALQRKDSEIHCAIQENEKENNKKMDRCSYQMKLQIEKISKTYEEKLQMLDLKIQELIAARGNQDQRIAESMAFEMTAKAMSDLNDRHNAKLQKYKETLRSIAEREREAIDGMRKVEAKMLCSDEDKKIALSRLYQAEVQITKMKESENESRRTIRSLQLSSDESMKRIIEMEENMKVQKKVFDEKLDNLDVEHSDELRLIDTKVRKIYQMRDDTISSLREKLSVAEKRQREVESILADLNSGFSSAPSCRISKHTR